MLEQRGHNQAKVFTAGKGARDKEENVRCWEGLDWPKQNNECVFLKSEWK
jgi:hypothetical protein